MSAESFPANGEPSLVSIPCKGSRRPHTIARLLADGSDMAFESVSDERHRVGHGQTGGRFTGQLKQRRGLNTSDKQVAGQPNCFVGSEKVHQQVSVEPQHAFAQLARQVVHELH